MSHSKEVFEKASTLINKRRINAEVTAANHLFEIEHVIPEIIEINNQIVSTSLEISILILNKSSSLKESINRIKENNLHAQEMIKLLLTQNGYPDDYIAVKYSCSKCEDSGYFRGQICYCFNNLLEQLSVENLNINSQIKLCSFETFYLSYYPNSKTNSVNIYHTMLGNLEYCKEYANSFALNSNSVFMLGMTGLGKTHLSLAIANIVIQKGFNVAYDSTPNYLRIVEKEHFGRSTTDTLQLLLNIDLLILDDLGAEFESSFYISCLYNIINTRLNKGLPTIVNSNLTTTELQKRYKDRIVSRLFAMYDYLKFVGNDIRQLKKISGEYKQ